MRRTIFVCGATFALVLTAMLSFLLANEEAQGQTTVNVDVGNFYFCNASFTRGVCETNINAGDTVTWTWVGAPHTVTQCETGFINCPPTGGFDSGFQLPIGGTFSHTFDSAGSFEYRCNFHPTEMRGRVIVAAAAQPTPTPSGGQTTAATPATGAGPTTSAATAATRTAAPAAPAAPPSTGGPPADGGPSWPLVLAIAGGVLVVGSAGAGLVVLRRR